MSEIKLGPAIHNARECKLVDGRFIHTPVPREVRVMATCEGYAMVRRKGAMPYVASVKELEQKPAVKGE